MKYLSFLLLLLLASNVFAGIFEKIVKDDGEYKRLSISVESKESPKDKNISVFSIKLKGTGLGTVYLLNQKTNLEIKPQIKDGIAELTFEIEKKHIEKATLNFDYPNGSRCPPSYFLELKDYIK